MKPTKFRVWDKKRKKMRSWSQILRSDLSVKRFFSLVGYEIMQFTGLKDKNGKEIYEGDIVNVFLAEEYPSEDDLEEEGQEWFDDRIKQAFVCKQEVKWWEAGGYFCTHDTGDFCHCLGDRDELIVEVIGNIYKNPELLEGGKK